VRQRVVQWNVSQYSNTFRGHTNEIIFNFRDWPYKIFTLSYLLYPLLGALMTVTVGFLVSALTGGKTRHQTTPEQMYLMYLTSWAKSNAFLRMFSKELQENQSKLFASFSPEVEMLRLVTRSASNQRFNIENATRKNGSLLSRKLLSPRIFQILHLLFSSVRVRLNNVPNQVRTVPKNGWTNSCKINRCQK
jgi:hypothetical protein